MRFSILATVCLLVGGPLQPVWGQFIRIPVFRPPIVRPPVVPHIPVHFPGTSRQKAAAANDSWEEALPWLGGGLILAAGGGGIWYLARKLRTKTIPRALVRIIALPPGEAPASVRAAWIGLELPLIVGQVRPEHGPAQQVLSGSQVNVPDGYAVDSTAAVEILESASAEAGQWWRDNVPAALTPGHQLVFPAEVCERLDDLGA